MSQEAPTKAEPLVLWGRVPILKGGFMQERTGLVLALALGRFDPGHRELQRKETEFLYQFIKSAI